MKNSLLYDIASSFTKSFTKNVKDSYDINDSLAKFKYSTSKTSKEIEEDREEEKGGIEE